MTQRIKVGNVYFELPEGTEHVLDPAAQRIIKAEKPETPEPLEEQTYIYRPNDPFQSAIDEARAIASIGSAHKPWVRKTWFVLFVLGPLSYLVFFALAAAQHLSGWPLLRSVLGGIGLMMPMWLIYFSIWRRKSGKPGAR
jgi:hypothetical protein